MGTAVPESVQHVVEDQPDDAWLRQFKRAKVRELVRGVPQYARSVSLPTDTSLTIKAIDVQISRKACPNPYDQIDITGPASSMQQVNQTSNNGFFKSSFWNGQLAVIDAH